MNRILDTWVRPDVRALGRPRSSFHVCGVIGLALALMLGGGLTLHRGLSPWVLGAVVLTALATFLTLAMATKLVVGEERLIYYHHEVAILAAVTVVLGLLGQPVVAYLDVTILGVGTFLVSGRVGCFMVGCCHGRPHRWGVRYRAEHAEVGFTPYLVNVRLFPIQLVESAWVLATVVVGAVLVLRGAAPGAALAWYVVVYDLGRFGFEFLRGDPARPYRAGFSEGQWTSLLLMLVVVGAELAGAIPLYPWHLTATAGVMLTMVGVTIYRRLRSGARHRLSSARHVQEVAEAVELLVAAAGPPEAVAGGGERVVNVVSTSAGLRISTGCIAEAQGEVRHYTLSADQALSEADARIVAGLLLRLRHAEASGEVVASREGVFHLLVRPTQKPRAALARAAGVAG